MDKKDESVEKPTIESAADQLMAVGKAAIERAQEVAEKAQQEGGKLLDSIAKEGAETQDKIMAVGKAAIERAQEVAEKAQQEGSKLFDSIAKESEKVRAQTQKLAGEKFEEAKEKFEEAKNKAVDTLDGLEQIFENRVSRVLSRLGIPSSEDFQSIAKRLDDLNKSVQALIKAKSAEKASATQLRKKDNLQAIAGVGPALEGKLNAAGIVTYRQIAALNAEDIERVETKVIHSSGRIARDNWVEQAKDLHFKKYNEQL